MGRALPRRRPKADGEQTPGRTSPDSARAADRAGDASSREAQVVDALEQLRQQLLAVPLGPTEGFRDRLRARVTAAPPRRSDRPGRDRP